MLSENTKLKLKEKFKGKKNIEIVRLCYEAFRIKKFTLEEYQEVLKFSQECKKEEIENEGKLGI